MPLNPLVVAMVVAMLVVTEAIELAYLLYRMNKERLLIESYFDIELWLLFLMSTRSREQKNQQDVMTVIWKC